MLNNAKYITVLIVTLLTINVSRAQLKYDTNWVFGNRCGINFSVPDTPKLFLTESYNNENSGSFSNENGSLLFYFSNYRGVGSFLRDYSFLLDSSENIILNSDTLMSHYTVTSGAIILKANNNKYLLFHLFPVYNDSRCNGIYCSKTYMSVISLTSCGEICVEKKNELITDYPIYERMSAIKHANGKDWWLLFHTEKKVNNTFRNTFIRYLITDTVVSGPFYQYIGVAQNNTNDFLGQMKISSDGNRLALVRYDSRIMELYDIDRCSGELHNYRYKQITNINSFSSYGLEFSKNGKYIYVSNFGQTPLGGGKTELYQIAYDSSQIYSPLKIYNSFSILYQLQIASNNNIYIAGQSGPSSNEEANNYNQNLSVIYQPDSSGLACNFQPYSFYLGDSSKSSMGLPNFPNYNLEALSIYEADAGRDTILCSNSPQPQKVALLGTPPVSGVQYQWYPNYNLSSDTVAQPLAYPDTSTWYYVLLSDTTITNACKSRLDSVYVEVSTVPNASFTYEYVNDTLLFTSQWNSLLSEYKWDFGDGTTATGNIVKHKYQVSADTTLTVRHIVSNTCGADTAYTTLVILGVTSLYLEEKENVRIYPNPATSEIKIESAKYKIAHLTIYDVTGKAQLSPFEEGVCRHCAQAGDETILNIKELAKGIYFIETLLSNGQTTINKLVKQ